MTIAITSMILTVISVDLLRKNKCDIIVVPTWREETK